MPLFNTIRNIQSSESNTEDAKANIRLPTHQN